MKTYHDLEALLKAIHKKSYPAYKETKGRYQFPEYILEIEHVQGDPFAAPSRVLIQVDAKQAKFPIEYYESLHRKIALQDYLLRRIHKGVSEINFKAKGSGKSGLIAVSRPGQEILERTACTIDPKDGTVNVHLEIGFPANGRTIQSFELIQIFFKDLPPVILKSLIYDNVDKQALQSAIWLSDDQNSIRKQLKTLNLVAFVADGAVLPRESGVSKKPMKDAVKFQSPASLRVELQLPHRVVSGMGIRKGITVIVGGGYHGKSTLLEAFNLGVYNHIAGDGREYVITDSKAVKIRAEDGRSIRQVDISLFMNGLPNQKDTKQFTTEDASGSTSQAANVMEGLEAGADVLLIDEDTSATNFMIRDELMQQVIQKEKEPITTFSERIQWLSKTCGISTILVVGSSGVFFSAADTVIQMDTYQAYDITKRAKQAARQWEDTMKQTKISCENPPALCKFERVIKKKPAFCLGERIKLKTIGLDCIQINRETVDIRYLEQLVDPEQAATLGYSLIYAYRYLFDGKHTMKQVVEQLLEKIEKEGLASIVDAPYLSSDLAMPRKQEIFSCFNRFRG